MKKKEHHNPYVSCPLCGGDEVWLCPPCMGEDGIYFCVPCSAQIQPNPKRKVK